MKNIIVTIACLLYSCSLFSQELSVKYFQLNEGDLSARTEKRLDSNGNQCALIKVEVIPACEFGGYVIGSVEKKLGAYWVYVCAKNPATRKLIVSSDNFQPLEVDFSKFGIMSLEAGLTYTLRIETIKPSAINIIGGHKYIDMGLSVNWADCNLGALSPQDAGDTYSWGLIFATGDTIPKDIKNICGTKYDAVSQLWGDEWRMPTEKELSELLYECISYDDIENNVEGKRIIGISGNSIFIPYTSSNVFIYKSLANNEVNGDLKDNKGTMLWSGNKKMATVPGSAFVPRFLGYFPAVTTLSQKSYETRSLKEQHKYYIRPVIRKQKVEDSSIFGGSPNNGRYLIKGQLIEDEIYGEIPISTPINIYDNKTGKFIQQIHNEKGLFELWVTKDQELRFEFDNEPEQESTIMKVRPVMKVHLWRKPTFGLG